MRAVCAMVLLASLASADPLPEGATLAITGPGEGTLIHRRRARVEITWRATGVPEGALVRVLRAGDDGAWRAIDGAQYLPAALGAFTWNVPREVLYQEKPETMQFGLVYLAPHAPKTWHVDGRTTKLADVAPQVRPGDTVEIAGGGGGVTLPGGVTVRSAAPNETQLSIEGAEGACLTIVAVPGLEATTRIEGLRFVARPKPEGRSRTAGVRLLGGAAELTRCTFERWLAIGVEAHAATVALRGCNASNEQGTAVSLEGGVGTVEGGVFSGCGLGILVGEHATGVVSKLVIDGGETGDGVWAMADTRVSVTECRIRARTGVSTSQGIGLHVESNEIEAADVGVRASMHHEREAPVRILSNKIKGADVGILLYRGADGVVAGNEIDGARQYGVRTESTSAAIRDNVIRMVARGAGWAPKQWSPYWQTGAVGIMSGLSGGGGPKPTIAGNTIRGYDTHPVALVWGADAILADNTFGDPKHAVYRSKDPYEGTHQIADADACARARALWERKHPEGR